MTTLGERLALVERMVKQSRWWATNKLVSGETTTSRPCIWRLEQIVILVSYNFPALVPNPFRSSSAGRTAPNALKCAPNLSNRTVGAIIRSRIKSSATKEVRRRERTAGETAYAGAV